MENNENRVEGIIEAIRNNNGIKIRGKAGLFWPSKFAEPNQGELIRNLNVGDTIGFDLTIDKSGYSHMRNIQVIRKEVVGGNPTVEIAPDPDLKWERKDRRIVRMNCVGNAITFCDDGKFDSDNVLMIAQRFFDWIYKED